MSRRHNVFARAARNMEKGRRIEGVGVPPYPCWYLAEEVGEPYYNWAGNDDVRRFLGAFSDSVSTCQRSGDFMYNLFDSEDERDRCILALCFAAAMADEGDI